MKKKILSLCLVVALMATAIAGATLANFTDTESETNVMTIGNVDITLHEIQKIKDTNQDGELDKEEFKDEDFVLYPISNEQGIQLINKQVDVENTSPSNDPVYIRTIIAIEDWFAGEEDVLGLHWRYFDQYVDVETYADLKIDGQEYDVLVFTNKTEAAYAKGEKQYSLGSVWLDENLTQEQIAKYFGEKVEILVLGQGIQATGLTHEEAMAELGEINSENLSAWFDTSAVVGNVIS